VVVVVVVVVNVNVNAMKKCLRADEWVCGAMRCDAMMVVLSFL